MNSGLVFSADGNTAKVITMSDISSSGGVTWVDDAKNNITNAQSLINGKYSDQTGNTYLIIKAYTPSPNKPDGYAAALCYNYTAGSVNAGDWYLPAICELDNKGLSGTPCNGDDNIDNIYSNLYELGFIQDINNGGDSVYWSSTEVSGALASGQAWSQQFISGTQSSGDSDGSSKYRLFAVRCVLAFSY
jgi:hypothetical protein